MISGNTDWLRWLFLIPVLLFSLSVHEFCHSAAAYRLGDITQKQRGRLTISPFKHVDLIGLLFVLLVGFGWARPVSVNPAYFAKDETEPESGTEESEKPAAPVMPEIKKGMKFGMVLSSAAGPVSNFLLAFVSILIYFPLSRVYEVNNFLRLDAVLFLSDTASPVPVVVKVFMILLQMSFSYNVMLGVFNMIPLPPLDGSKVFFAFLPGRTYFRAIRGNILTVIAFIAIIWSGKFADLLGQACMVIYRIMLTAADAFYFFLK